MKHKLVKSADVIIRNPTRRFKDNGVVSHGNADLAVTIREEQDPKPWQHPVTGRRLSLPEHDDLRYGSKAQQARAAGYAWKPRTELPVGAASLIGKDLTIEDGDVVEVLYLYATEDQQVIQPRIVRKRTDKTPAECDLEQFPPYTRALAWVGSTEPLEF